MYWPSYFKSRMYFVVVSAMPSSNNKAMKLNFHLLPASVHCRSSASRLHVCCDRRCVWRSGLNMTLCLCLCVSHPSSVSRSFSLVASSATLWLWSSTSGSWLTPLFTVLLEAYVQCCFLAGGFERLAFRVCCRLCVVWYCCRCSVLEDPSVLLSFWCIVCTPSLGSVAPQLPKPSRRSWIVEI